MAFLVKLRLAPFQKALLVLLIYFVGVLALPSSYAQTDNTRECQIKAAFLFNFLQFVKWPNTAFPSPNAPLSIGVLGSNSFGNILDSTIRGESIDGHPLVIIRGNQFNDLRTCQVIFISRSQSDYFRDILSQIGNSPILTISEVEGFARSGGDINFYLSDSKVRFEINPQAAKQCGLRISSQLLALGKIVVP